MNNQIKNKGFSMIELLVYMSLFSIVIVLLADMFASLLSVQLKTQSTSYVEQDGRYILTRLMRDVATAQSIATPSLGGQTTPTLTLTLPADTYTYALTTGNLTLTTGTGIDVLNGFDTTVSNLSFTKITNTGAKDTVRINYTVTSKTKTPTGTKSVDYQTTVGLR